MYIVCEIEQDDGERNTATWSGTRARALHRRFAYESQREIMQNIIENKNVTLVDCFTFPCYSPKLDRSFCVTIYRNSSIGLGEALPTVYLTDSVVNFPIAYGAIQIMQFQGGMRDFNLVGIGYEDVTTSTKMRVLDLTPCADVALAGVKNEHYSFPLLNLRSTNGRCRQLCPGAS